MILKNELRKGKFIHRLVSKRLLLIFLLILGVSAVLPAQPPDTLWSRTFGGSNIDIGHCIVETSDGGFIVTGYTRSYGNLSGRNLLLLKIDAQGNLEWVDGYGGSDDDEGYAVQEAPDGGFVAVGLTKSFGAGQNDLLLLKVDSSGTLEWLKVYGGTNDDEGYSLQKTSDGGYIIAGVTSSFGAGSRDAWVIKTDANGNSVWTATYGGLSSDGARSIQRTRDGGYIFTGWTFSSGPGYLGNAWLVKLDSLGNQQWSRAYGAADVDRGYSVCQTSDGGFAFIGYTDSFGNGLDDLWLVKTDSLGNELWNRTFGGSGRDYGNCILESADGGLVLLGYTRSFGAGDDDVWLIKTDADGNEEWSRTFGGSSSDVGYFMQQTSDNGFILTGHTLSYGAGLHDVWVIRLAPEPVGIDEFHVPIQAFDVSQNYPNPFNPVTSIQYSVSSGQFIELKVFDLLGREVKTLAKEWQPAGSYLVQWDGTNDAGVPVPSGVYIYRFQAGDFQKVRKMMLLK